MNWSWPYYGAIANRLRELALMDRHHKLHSVCAAHSAAYLMLTVTVNSLLDHQKLVIEEFSSLMLSFESHFKCLGHKFYAFTGVSMIYFLHSHTSTYLSKPQISSNYYLLYLWYQTSKTSVNNADSISASLFTFLRRLSISSACQRLQSTSNNAKARGTLLGRLVNSIRWV